MIKHLLTATFLAFALLALAACGGDSLGDSFGEAARNANNAGESAADFEDFGDAVTDVFGEQGGSGILIWDGVEYPIDSVTCVGNDERVDSGTASQSNGFRVFVSGFLDDLGPQILDPEFVQWFDGDRVDPATRDLVTFDGKTYTAPTNTWWNNLDDRIIEASFTYECP